MINLAQLFLAVISCSYSALYSVHVQIAAEGSDVVMTEVP
jgi:hypothetical protein